MLMGALQFVHVPGYASLLLRRSFADLNLPEALIPLSHRWLQGTRATWDGQKHLWSFPSGAVLQFGYLETENDKYRYQSSAFQNIGFDELSQFKVSQYEYLSSRLRKPTGMNVPLRMRAGSNPGGVGHEWVKQRFIDATRAIGRMFIPAKLEDNPGIDRASYEESLNKLDPVTRAQLRYGDWSIRPEGNLFKREWFAGKLVSESDPIIRTVRYWDLAATPLGENGNTDPDWTVGLLLGLTAHKQYYILDVERFRGSALEVKRRMRETAIRDGTKTEVCVEQEGGASGKIVAGDIVREVLFGFSAYAVKPRTGKVERSKPAQAASERGDVFIVAGHWVDAFLEELCAFGTETAHDDQCDAFSGAFERLSAAGRDWNANDWNKVFSTPESQAVEEVESGIERRLLAGLIE